MIGTSPDSIACNAIELPGIEIASTSEAILYRRDLPPWQTTSSIAAPHRTTADADWFKLSSPGPTKSQKCRSPRPTDRAQQPGGLRLFVGLASEQGNHPTRSDSAQLRAACSNRFAPDGLEFPVAASRRDDRHQPAHRKNPWKAAYFLLDCNRFIHPLPRGVAKLATPQARSGCFSDGITLLNEAVYQSKTAFTDV